MLWLEKMLAKLQGLIWALRQANEKLSRRKPPGSPFW